MISCKNSYFIFQRIASCFILLSMSLSLHCQHLVGVQRGYLASHNNTTKISSQEKKQLKKINKAKKNEKKEQEQAKKELIKAHLKLQDKPTRKRMKMTLKKSKRLKKGIKLVPFWYKWKYKESNSIKRKRDVVD
tara:strand:- start:4497 stop:4898 length:402 start_codon:yes stop_codon:yes gene_type:complete